MRTEQTKEQYFKRSVYLIKKAHKEANEKKHKALKAINVYKDLNGKQFMGLSLYNTAIWIKQFWGANLRPKTLRQYRASFIYFCELELENKRLDIDTFEKVKLILTTTKSGDNKKLELKTSAKKQKHLRIKDLDFISEKLKTSKNKWALPTRIWLISGIITGLRPVEWRQTTYSIEDDKLIIKNAKNTNGRSHGEFRSIYLNHVPEKEKIIILKHLELATAFSNGGDDSWTVYYQGCANLLKYTCDTIWPKREKRPTLYSARHQFSANLKASGCKPEEVAALMGHAVDDTAMTTYGKKVNGTRGLKPKINQEELNKVKKSKNKISFNIDDMIKKINLKN